MPTLDTFGQTIEYEIIRSEEATKPRIDVDIHGVRVVIPTDDTLDPETFLSEHAGWVLDKRRRYEYYRAKTPERTFEVGAKLPYLCEDRPLRVQETANHHLTDSAFVLARSEVADFTIQTELEQLYRSRACEEFETRCQHYAEQMGVSYERLEMRNQRTRWARCSPQDTLSFNWRLVMTPPDVVDYIVVHELAHLRERKNRGPVHSRSSATSKVAHGV